MMIFEIKQGDESLTSHSGLALIGALLHKTQLDKRLNAVVLPDHPHPEISHGTITKSMIGLLCLGKPDFEAIEPFRADPFFFTSLNLPAVPSQGTLRQRLNDAQGRFDAILKEESANMIKRHAPQISPGHKKHVPLDIDVSPFDNSGTKKEGVSWTYKRWMDTLPSWPIWAKKGIGSTWSCGKKGGARNERAYIRKLVSRRRLRSVMQDLIYMASRVVTNAHRMGMTFKRWNSWYPVWQLIYNQFVGAYG